MKKRSTWASVLLRSLATLPLAGCSLFQPSETQLPGTTKLLDEVPRVQNSPRSPCWQQEQIAAQNSYFETIKAKKEVVYQAPCKVDKPKIAEARK